MKRALRLVYGTAVLFFFWPTLQGFAAEGVQKRARPQELLRYAEELRENANKAALRLQFLELQAGKLHGAMGTLVLKIAENERKVSTLLEELRVRLIDIYKFGSTEEFNLLLSAEDTHDAIVAAYLLGRISRQRQSVAENLLNAKADLESSKKNLEWNRKALVKQVQEIKELKEKYDVLGDKAGSMARRTTAPSQRKIDVEPPSPREELGAVVARYRNRKNLASEALEISPAFDRRLHFLEWPVVGPVVRMYGSRVHPVKKTREFNPGIDIRAASHTVVKASWEGRVCFDARHRTLGGIVMIDHGGDILTVYAHLSSLRVKEGDSVRAGTPIGTVGNLDGAGGYGVHFEVREGARPQNPLEYLRRF